MEITAAGLASRFVGVKEVPGVASNPQIVAMLDLDVTWPKDDAVPWCSAFVNYICWLLGLPRTKTLWALSWTKVGTPIELSDARPGFDIVVLTRDGGGHVGFYMDHDIAANSVTVLGGNQSDSVSVAKFNVTQIRAIRRLA